MGTLLLGEIESSLLQGYFGELRTKEVVVTEERMEHIRKRHPEDVELFALYGKETVRSRIFCWWMKSISEQSLQ